MLFSVQYVYNGFFFDNLLGIQLIEITVSNIYSFLPKFIFKNFLKSPLRTQSNFYGSVTDPDPWGSAIYAIVSGSKFVFS